MKLKDDKKNKNNLILMIESKNFKFLLDKQEGAEKPRLFNVLQMPSLENEINTCDDLLKEEQANIECVEDNLKYLEG